MSTLGESEKVVRIQLMLASDKGAKELIPHKLWKNAFRKVVGS